MNITKHRTFYDEYVAYCAAAGLRPLSPDAFERLRLRPERYEPERALRFIGWGYTFLWCMLIVAAFLWMSGCSAAGEREIVEHPQPVLALSGDTEIDAALLMWSARWESATGMSVLFSPDGAPVARSDDGMSNALDENGQLDCAETVLSHDGHTQWVSSLTVRLTRPEGCPDTSTIIGHELGHVLGGYQAQHSMSGVFQAYIGAADSALVIDDNSLLSVCAHMRCAAFNPEKRDP